MNREQWHLVQLTYKATAMERFQGRLRFVFSWIKRSCLELGKQQRLNAHFWDMQTDSSHRPPKVQENESFPT